jgi:hypothetical protein
MAELPKYKSSAVFADVPQFNFANVQEAFRQSTSLSNNLDRLSTFAFKRAEESALQQAVEFTANNPPTPEQIELAKTGEFNPQDLVGGGGVVFETAVRKLQADQLRNSLQINLQGEYVNVLNDVKNKKITTKEELDAKLAAPVMGMEKVLVGFDPESAIKFKAFSATQGFQVNVAANKQFEENFREEQDIETIAATDSGIELAHQASLNLGTSNPKRLKQEIDLIRSNIIKAGNNGTEKKAKEELKRFDDNLEAFALGGLDKTRDDVVRLAASGNPKSELALSIATKEMAQYADVLGISPQNREKYVLGTIEDFHVARLESDFDKAPNKQAFLKSLEKDIKKGPVGDLFDANGNPVRTDRLSRGIDLPKLQALTNKFEAEIRAQRAEYNALKSELNSDITEANRISSLGATVPQTQISALQQRARSLGLPASDITVQKINTLSVLNENTNSYKKMNSVQLSEIQRKLEQDTMNGATLLQAEQLNHIRQYKAKFEEGLKKDPVSMMNKSGVPVNTLDFSADPKNFKSQIEDRVAKSKIYAEQQGIPVQFFANDEASALSTFLQTADVNQQLGMIAKITDGFGKDAPRAMAEISKFSPEYAHIGGLMMSGASSTTVKDALNGIKQKQAGNKPFEMGGDAVTKQMTIANQLGNAYYNSAQTRNNIVTVANAIYTQRAIMRGDTQFNEDVYQEAFQEAAGAVKFTDKSWYGGSRQKLAGGIIDYKGMKLPIPNNIAQDEFEDIISKATYADFEAAANGKLVDAKGRKYTVERLRDAYPAPINTDESFLYYGEYRDVANPQQFYTQDGKPVRINFRKLANIVKSK